MCTVFTLSTGTTYSLPYFSLSLNKSTVVSDDVCVQSVWYMANSVDSDQTPRCTASDLDFTVFYGLCIVILYTERKKKRRVNFIPKFHSSLKKFVKYFTMITKQYMYGTKVPNFIGL